MSDLKELKRITLALLQLTESIDSMAEEIPEEGFGELGALFLEANKKFSKATDPKTILALIEELEMHRSK
jgi:hypothetical protein